MEIDEEDHLYIVDKAARIQVFTREGDFLRGWRTPQFANGKPTGLSWDNAGRLMVADTHYFRILFYTKDGELLEHLTIGGQEGYDAPGRFGWVTDAVQDSQGNYYIAEYGEFDRVQKYAPNGQFLFQWGGHGEGPLQFKRPQNLAIDGSDHLWVVDACNHRIQVFDATGATPRLLRSIGQMGDGPGQFRYPYDLVLDDQGHFYVCEFGNHRVQKFTVDGQFLASWGRQGRQEGELHNPWSIVRDSHGRIHVLDTYNNRVQRIRL
jgi:sugar lactone lactonase YvrE